MEFINKEHFTSITSSFQSLLFKEPGYLSDITLVTEDQKFLCHKVILSSACPYFYTMFHSPLRESTEKEIVLHGINKNVMEALINYIYLGKIEINNKNAQGILCVADMMDLQPLKKACCDFFLDNIDPSNCLGLQTLALQTNCYNLHERTWKFALCNFHEVINEEEFLSLSLEDVTEYIKSPLLNVSKEEQAVDAVLKWLSNGNEKYISQLFKSIHTDQLSTNYISKILVHPTIQKCCKTKKLLERISCGEVIQDPSYKSILEPRMFTGLQTGIFILGNSPTMNVCEDKTENVCLGIATNQPSIVCSSIDVPIPLLQQNHDDLLDTVSCCSIDNIVYVSGFQGREDQLWKYDPLYKIWSFSTIFLSYRSSHNLVSNNKDIVYAVGGMDPYLDIFDEQIEQLTLSSDQSVQIGSLHAPVKWGGCLFYDEKILLFGGESWNYTYYHAEASDLIQMFDTLTCQTTVLHTRLFAPTDIARAMIYHDKVILMDSDSTWIIDAPQLIANERDGIVYQIVKPGSDSIYFSAEIIDNKVFVIAGESGKADDESDMKVVKYAQADNFIAEGKEVDWKVLGQLTEPLKVCATCKVQIKFD